MQTYYVSLCVRGHASRQFSSFHFLPQYLQDRFPLEKLPKSFRFRHDPAILKCIFNRCIRRAHVLGGKVCNFQAKRNFKQGQHFPYVKNLSYSLTFYGMSNVCSARTNKNPFTIRIVIYSMGYGTLFAVCVIAHERGELDRD